MKTDYPELEGKEVTFVQRGLFDKTNCTAKVSGCNYHIGISIESPKYGYLLCLNGKQSPKYKEYTNPFPQYIYRRLFHEIVKQIQNGHIDIYSFVETTSLQICNRNPTAKDCPFAQ